MPSLPALTILATFAAAVKYFCEFREQRLLRNVRRTSKYVGGVEAESNAGGIKHFAMQRKATTGQSRKVATECRKKATVSACG